jgi:membrane-associated phospholipid phosphatase
MLPRPRTALLGAIACAAALVLDRVLAFATGTGRGVDASALQGFVDLRSVRSVPLANAIAHLADPVPFALLGVALIVIALLRGRPRVALALPVILLGANATTQLLKPALAHQRSVEWLSYPHHISAAAWPSGHATASMTLALCAVLVAPPRLRPALAVVGAGFAVAVCYALLTLGWHFPSDVLGGYLVAMTWTLLSVAALLAAGARWPARTGRDAVMRRRDALVPLGAATLGAGGLAALIAVAHPFAVIAYGRSHTAFVAGAFAIAALGAALATGLALALRR